MRQLEERVRGLSELLQSQPAQPEATTQDSQRKSMRNPAHEPVLNFNSSPQQHQIQDSNVQEPNNGPLRRHPDQEVSGVNQHTRNMEYYGNSSYMALLSHVSGSDVHAEHEASLLSSLHNPAFTPPKTDSTAPVASKDSSGHSNHYPQCRGFLEYFFTAVHYIHPILDKTAFFERCETLWYQHVDDSSTFAALYYSVLSFGALISPRDDEPLRGIDNVQWSRLFFKEASSRCTQLTMITNLDMVQCYFFMAKVCQNEIIPHWSYMYVGLAVRTALAIGINRAAGPNSRKSPVQIRADSRTWWGLYSFETEMSFAMGRPDTLGADLYHNQRFSLISNVDVGDPDLLEPPHCAIIRSMVDFSRVMRKVCLSIYLSEISVSKAVDVIKQIEQDLDHWVAALPQEIRPRLQSSVAPSLQDAKSPRWVKRQRLVLTIRYHNLRILLFGSLLLRYNKAERAAIPGSYEGVQKCVESAQKTIEIISHTYLHDDFFRTWFYNTTYTVFAASMILIYVNREATGAEIQPLLQHLGMSIDILELMTESVVAQEAAKLLKRSKDASEKGPGATSEFAEDGRLLNHYWGRLDLLDGPIDFDTMFQLANGGNDDFFLNIEGQ